MNETLNYTSKFIIANTPNTLAGENMVNMSTCLHIRGDIISVSLQDSFLLFILCSFLGMLLYQAWQYTSWDAKYLRIAMTILTLFMVVFFIQMMLG